jgi:hypothetical protein
MTPQSGLSSKDKLLLQNSDCRLHLLGLMRLNCSYKTDGICRVEELVVLRKLPSAALVEKVMSLSEDMAKNLYRQHLICSQDTTIC